MLMNVLWGKLPLKTDCVDVADIRQTFYNVNSFFWFIYKCHRKQNLKCSKEIYLYTKIWLDNNGLNKKKRRYHIKFSAHDACLE